MSAALSPSCLQAPTSLLQGPLVIGAVIHGVSGGLSFPYDKEGPRGWNVGNCIRV